MLAPVVCVLVKLQEQTNLYLKALSQGSNALGFFYTKILFVMFVNLKGFIMKNLTEYKSGIKNGIPILLGYFAVSFAFGIQASKVGLTIFQSGLMSFTNFTSTGQFATLTIIASAGTIGELVFSQIVINLRYLLMSCTLSQKFNESTPLYHRLLVAVGVTDEIFGVSVTKKSELSPFYSYGLTTSAISGWTFGTILGVISGDFLPANIISALGIAIYGMFVAIIMPEAKKEKSVLGVVISSMIISCLMYYLPFLNQISAGFRIIIITIIISVIAALLFPVKEDNANGS